MLGFIGQTHFRSLSALTQSRILQPLGGFSYNVLLVGRWGSLSPAGPSAGWGTEWGCSTSSIVGAPQVGLGPRARRAHWRGAPDTAGRLPQALLRRGHLHSGPWPCPPRSRVLATCRGPGRVRDGTGSSGGDSWSAGWRARQCVFLRRNRGLDREILAGGGEKAREGVRRWGGLWAEAGARCLQTLRVVGCSPASPTPPPLPRPTRGRGCTRAAGARVLAEPSVSSSSGGRAPGGGGALVGREKAGHGSDLPRARGRDSAS